MALSAALRLEQLTTFCAAKHMKLIAFWRAFWRLLFGFHVFLDGFALGVSPTVDCIVGGILIPVLEVLVADVAVIVFSVVFLMLPHFLIGAEVLEALREGAFDLSLVRHGGELLE
jgi:hypothetical protein